MGKEQQVSRGSRYSPEEDAIILQTAGQSGADTNARLVSAGFEPRTDNALKARRYELKRKGGGASDGQGGADEITRLVARRGQLERAIGECRARLEVLEQEAAEVRAQLFKAVAAEVGEEVPGQA